MVKQTKGQTDDEGKTSEMISPSGILRSKAIARLYCPPHKTLSAKRQTDDDLSDEAKHLSNVHFPTNVSPKLLTKAATSTTI